jgi:hypothetical protein
MEGTIQYVADTFLLERTFQILAELDDDGLEKRAFDLSSLLGSAGSSIRSIIGEQIHGKDEGGVARTVIDFLAPAMFFRLNPILGMLVTAAQFFGFDIYSIYEKIVGLVIPSLKSGKPVSAEHINDAAKAAIPVVGDEAMGAEASNDFLYPLRDLQKQGMLTKEGLSGGQFSRRVRQVGQRAGQATRQFGRGAGQATSEVGRAWGDNPFAPKSENPLLRMFSFMGRRKGSSLIVGILVWFLKTVLMSAGMLAVGGVAASALGIGKSKGKDQSGTPTTSAPASTTPTPSTTTGVPAPTGIGSYNYRPNKGDLWVEGLQGQQPYERVLQWVAEVYPDLYQYQDIVVRTPSFWNAVRAISQTWIPGQQQLVVPEPYKTRNDILEQFIPDVYRAVNQQRGT